MPTGLLCVCRVSHWKTWKVCVLPRTDTALFEAGHAMKSISFGHLKNLDLPLSTQQQLNWRMSKN